jgi:very-short-patch-repair endonuclease
VVRSWAELPVGRVVRLDGADADALTLAVEPLPENAPAILTYFATGTPTTADMVTAVLRDLEYAAVALFPAWLPEAEGIAEPGGAGLRAVRALALRAAATTDHFGPFLADLAELSLTSRLPSPESRRTAKHRAATSPELRPKHRLPDLEFGVLPPSSRKRAREFSPETRATGLARVLAASFGRSRTALLTHVPEDLSPSAQEVFVAGCEWLAHRGGLGVWLTGAPLPAVDRVQRVTFHLPQTAAHPETSFPSGPAFLGSSSSGRPSPAVHGSGVGRVGGPEATGDGTTGLHAGTGTTGPHVSAGTSGPHVGGVESGPGGDVGGGLGDAGMGAVRFPAVAGKPHPASRSEQALEVALAAKDWARGRAWNQTYQPHSLAVPMRVDLLWREERCVVEIDGPDHRRPLKFADDRRRDVQLQLAGYAVLRFTDVHVLTDPEAVVHQIGLFLTNRRYHTPNEDEI